MSLNPVHGTVYSMQHYVFKSVIDLRRVSGFFQVHRFPPPIKLTATIQLKYCWSGIKHHKLNQIKSMCVLSSLLLSVELSTIFDTVLRFWWFYPTCLETRDPNGDNIGFFCMWRVLFFNQYWWFFFCVFSIKLSMKYVNRFCMSLTVLKK